MFTGLIEETGKVVSVKNSGDGKILEIKGNKVLEGTVTGDSISVNGACQTVTDITAETFSVFVSKVTLGITTLGDFKPGFTVNLERALTLTTRLGGHIVQGHVDQTAVCTDVVEADGSWYYTFRYRFDKEMAKKGYLTVDKGSVTVNGVSLTVVTPTKDTFKVAIIPFTYEMSNFHQIEKGTVVNLEFDIIGKYISRIVALQS